MPEREKQTGTLVIILQKRPLHETNKKRFADLFIRAGARRFDRAPQDTTELYFSPKRSEALEVSSSGFVYWRGRARELALSSLKTARSSGCRRVGGQDVEGFPFCGRNKSSPPAVRLRGELTGWAAERFVRHEGRTFCRGETVNGALVPHFWRRREMSSFIKAARRLGPVVI